jgi:hypothetical protein
MLAQVLATRSDVAPTGIYLRCFGRVDMVCQSQAGDFVCVDRSTGIASSHLKSGIEYAKWKGEGKEEE